MDNIVIHRSFREQFLLCEKTGNCILVPCDEEIPSLHNGIIKLDQAYFCKKYNVPCTSAVCRGEREKIGDLNELDNG